MSLKKILKEYTIRDYIEHVTSSDAFKKWFGKSVIKYKDGTPMVVYHGTNADFDKFTKTKDIGFHFGTVQASNTAINRRSLGFNKHDYILDLSDMVLPTEEQIKNNDFNSFWDKFYNVYKNRYGDTLINGFKNNFQKLYRLLNDEDYDNSLEFYLKQLFKIYDLENLGAKILPIKSNIGRYFIKIENPYYGEDLGNWELQDFKETDFEDLNEQIDECNSVEQITQVFLNNGYDGYIYKNYMEDSGEYSFVVFKPENIKSIFNKGTFKSNSPYLMETI